VRRYRVVAGFIVPFDSAGRLRRGRARRRNGQLLACPEERGSTVFDPGLLQVS
jgi:hypothetical protein